MQDVDGKVAPLITGSFWCDSQGMYSDDIENDLLANGLNTLAIQLSEVTKAIKERVEINVSFLWVQG